MPRPRNRSRQPFLCEHMAFPHISLFRWYSTTPILKSFLTKRKLIIEFQLKTNHIVPFRFQFLRWSKSYSASLEVIANSEKKQLSSSMKRRSSQTPGKTYWKTVVVWRNNAILQRPRKQDDKKNERKDASCRLKIILRETDSLLTVYMGLLVLHSAGRIQPTKLKRQWYLLRMCRTVLVRASIHRGLKKT